MCVKLSEGCSEWRQLIPSSLYSQYSPWSALGFEQVFTEYLEVWLILTSERS